MADGCLLAPSRSPACFFVAVVEERERETGKFAMTSTEPRTLTEFAIHILNAIVR